MKRLVMYALVAAIYFVPAAAWGQETEIDRVGSAVVTQARGGSVRITWGARVVSAKSSLELDWVMVRDTTMGLTFDGPVGVKGYYDSPWFRYNANLRMHALAPITAFEVRVLTFNVWNQFTGTLSFTHLEDMAPGQRKAFDRVWGLYGEGPLREHQRSVAYVARVKFADGTVVVADPTPALKAAQRIQSTVTLQDLEPKEEPVRQVTT